MDTPHGEIPGGARSRERYILGRAERHASQGAFTGAESLLIAALALFNESADLDATLGQTLTMLTSALDGRIGEIWLRGEGGADVELRYSSSDGAPGVVAFEAVGKALGLGAGPALVSQIGRAHV